MTLKEDKLMEYYFFLHGVTNLRYAAPELIRETLSLYEKLNQHQRVALQAGYEKSKKKLYNL